MSKKLLTLLTLPCLLFASCKSVKNENAIYSIMNYEEKDMIELKAESVEFMIKEKYSFPLLMFTTQCTYCDKAKENLAKISDDLGIAIYKVEMFTASIDYLVEKLPDYYSVNDSYPFLYFIKEGNVSYKASADELTNLTNAKKMFKSYTINTNIYTVTEKSSYESFKNVNKEYFVFTYDSSVLDEQQIYSKYIFSQAFKSNKKLLIIDKKTAKSDLIAEIYQDLDLSTDDQFDILSYQSSIEGKSVQDTIKYSSETDAKIREFISSYF